MVQSAANPGANQTAAPGGGEAPEVLRVEGLRKKFGAKVVLDGLDLTVRSGDNVAILGKSGSGKSVLLKIITGLLEPEEGQVFLWGQPAIGLSEEEWAPLRRRLGLVFQSGALFDSMSVRENIAFPLFERKTPASEVWRMVEERLGWVGLESSGPLPPSELSGGMRRRVALARTLSASPELLLYDEPTTGLDPITGRKISCLMRDLDIKLHSTTILVTHDLDCARTVCSRWAFLSEGRVLVQGTPEELLRSTDPEVREFVSGESLARNLPERNPVESPGGNPAPRRP